MIRLRRASVVVVLCLLTSATTAYAEWWVLWRNATNAVASGRIKNGLFVSDESRV